MNSILWKNNKSETQNPFFRESRDKINDGAFNEYIASFYEKSTLSSVLLLYFYISVCLLLHKKSHLPVLRNLLVSNQKPSIEEVIL